MLLAEWYVMPALPDEASHPVSSADWERLRDIRTFINRELERLRVAGEIGSSLDAEVDLYCGADYRAVLELLGDELRFMLICSYVRLHDVEGAPVDIGFDPGVAPDLVVQVHASTHPKCVRCWHHREDVGGNAEHPELCGRCIENVSGAGERRKFA